MKKTLLFFTGLAMAGTDVFAQADTLRMIEMQEVEVTLTRATPTTPFAFTDMDREQIGRVNYGQDLPFLLLQTPSVVATSDAGTGIGYTSIRVRGTDATRINVTANGVPMNDAESHSLFWVNMPDLASSLEDIQVQRGVGTSVTGAGAFGASINMKTETLPTTPFAEMSGSYGSFNTYRETVKFGTGLVGGHWAFSARLSNIGSDGYIDRASVDMKSYFAQGAYYARNTVVKFITFAGKEQTYHAWNGITKQQMKELGRRYNSSGYMGKDGNGKRLFYDDQTDNYLQYNYQLYVAQKLGQRWDMNLALHYTDGEGYYEEYKDNRTLVQYGLQPFIYVAGGTGAAPIYDTVKKSDLVRRKMMENGFGGGVFSFNYNSDKLRATIGGGANHYGGEHYGRVIWVKSYAGDSGLGPDHEYYRNRSDKTDLNIYARADWQVAPRLHLYGDMQYRYIHHKIHGASDDWNWHESNMQVLAVDKTYNFFNPKAGLFYEINGSHNVYASFAVAHKEPTRNNFTDAKPDADPRSERLFDYEAGYNFRSQVFSAGANLYYMDYKDQLVLTGEVNHIGEALADNVAKSYRMGVELMAGVKISRWLRWDVNATLSCNKVKDYTEYFTDYDEEWEEIGTQTEVYLGRTNISFSPDLTVGSLLSADFCSWTVALQSNYVSRQYITNTGRRELSIDPYFVNNLRVAYTFELPTIKSLTLGIAVNNIFNTKYENNAYGYSSNVISADGSSKRYDEAYYFPQAGTNVLANIVIRF